jgi:hypothetical protein
MSDAEPINTTNQKAIQLLGVNMAEAVQRDGGRLTDDQIDRRASFVRDISCGIDKRHTRALGARISHD